MSPAMLVAPAETTEVQVGQPETPFSWYRGRRRPTTWPVIHPRTGWKIGEVWRTGESFVTYVMGTGVRVGTNAPNIAAALAAVGWTQVGWPQPTRGREAT